MVDAVHTFEGYAMRHAPIGLTTVFLERFQAIDLGFSLISSCDAVGCILLTPFSHKPL